MLNEGKNPKNVKSDILVALTNILCKIFERMTNKRLIWYLEKERKINERQFVFRKKYHRRNIKKKQGFRKEKTAVILFDTDSL